MKKEIMSLSGDSASFNNDIEMFNSQPVKGATWELGVEGKALLHHRYQAYIY